MSTWSLGCSGGARALQRLGGGEYEYSGIRFPRGWIRLGRLCEAQGTGSEASEAAKHHSPLSPPSLGPSAGHLRPGQQADAACGAPAMVLPAGQLSQGRPRCWEVLRDQTLFRRAFENALHGLSTGTGRTSDRSSSNSRWKFVGRWRIRSA